MPIGAQDLAVYGAGDTAGYHLYTASATADWKWRALTTITPGGNTDQR